MIVYFKDIPLERHHVYVSSSVASVEELRYKRHLTKALEELKDFLRGRGVHAYKLRNTYKEELWWVVQNTAYCVKARATFFHYSRSSNYYTGKKLGWVKLRDLLYILEEEGLIDLYMGCSYPTEVGYILGDSRGIRSRVRPTGILDIVKSHQTKVCNRIKLGGEVTIRKRDTKKPINTMDNGGVSLLQDLLDEYNKYLEEVDVRIGEDKLTVHQYDKIFTDDLEGGGRYYLNMGGSQNMPKELRKDITIDGCKVAELDYRSMHPYVLYELASKDNPKGVMEHIKHRCKDGVEGFDPYYDGHLVKLNRGDLERFEEEWGYIPDTARNLMKKVLLIAMNSDSVSKAKMSIAYAIRNDKMKWKTNPQRAEFYGLGLVDIDKLIEFTKQYNEPISDKLFAGNSLYLQHMDASIMDKIVLYTMQNDITILPMHDGVICKETDIDAVKYFMEEAWMEHFGSTTFCKIKREY